MRVLLVSANSERINMPTMPLGLAMVATATRACGHDVAFLDLLAEKDPDAALRRIIAAHRPEVIGISVRNIDDQARESPRFLLAQVRPVVETCRDASVAPIVLGGAGYSIFPGEALAYLGADLGVAGDGEEAFPALLDALAKGGEPGSVPGVHVAGPLPAAGHAVARSLDALPAHGEELWAALNPSAPEVWVPVQGRRGCANLCSYCSTPRIQGRAIRSRDPEAVAEDVTRAAAAGFTRFFLVDNSFNIPESYALELCGRLAELRPQVEWRCIVYPHRVREELVEAMKVAGCVEVSLGFESGCLRILRAMNKHFTPADVRHAAELLAAHGIRRMGFLLLGGPGETRESVEESLAFAESLRLDTLRITVGIRIYPDTPLARLAVEEGVVAPGDDLLEPRFYLAPGLEPWIYDRVTPGIHPPPAQGTGDRGPGTGPLPLGEES